MCFCVFVAEAGTAKNGNCCKSSYPINTRAALNSSRNLTSLFGTIGEEEVERRHGGWGVSQNELIVWHLSKNVYSNSKVEGRWSVC